MPSTLRSWIAAAAMAVACCAQAQENKLHEYTALVRDVDSNLKVKLLIEALMEADPNAKIIPEDAMFTRILRIESYRELDLATLNERVAASHFHIEALAHGAAPVQVMQGEAPIPGEPYLIETGDAANDRLRYEDAKHVWDAAHPNSKH